MSPSVNDLYAMIFEVGDDYDQRSSYSMKLAEYLKNLEERIEILERIKNDGSNATN